MTQNHGYNQPSEGTKDWHIPLNENFSKFDTDIEIRDSESNLGNYTPKSGAKFLATDTANVFVGNGSGWDKLGSISKRVVEPSKGSSGIQRAADSLGGPGIIQLKEGQYDIDNKISLMDGQELVGGGMYGTVLRATSNIDGHALVGGESANNLSVRNLTIDMDNQGFSAIFFFIADRCRIHRVRALNAGSRSGGSDGGILLRNAFDDDGFDNVVTQCVARNCSNVSIDVGAGGTNPARSIVYGNKIYNPKGNQQFTHGISVENVDHAVVMGNTAIEDDGNGPRWSPAYNINAAGYVSVVGNTVQNVVNGFHTANGPSTGNQFQGNTIYNYSDTGLRVSNSGAGPATDVNVVGNTFDAGGNSSSKAVTIGPDCSGSIYNNVFLKAGSGIFTSKTRHPIQVANNKFRDIGVGIRIQTHQQSVPEPHTITGNYFNNYVGGRDIDVGSMSADNQPREVIIQNNTILGATSDDVQGRGIELNENGRCTVENNYIRYSIFEPGKGNIKNNQIGGKISEPTVRTTITGNSSATSPISSDNNLIKGTIKPTGEYVEFPIGGPRAGDYTGDGTTSRKIPTAMSPEYVVVKSSDGQLYDSHAIFGKGYIHGSPSGDLKIEPGGFVIGDGGSGADPNISETNYSYYVR